MVSDNTNAVEGGPGNDEDSSRHGGGIRMRGVEGLMVKTKHIVSDYTDMTYIECGFLIL